MFISFLRALLFTLAMALTAISTTKAMAEKRVALVIGNSAYKFSTQLPNPKNDASLMANVLRGAGFQVISGIDSSKQEMDAKLNEFTEAAYDADVAFIYYAGHGMQVDGKNYLIPVDAELAQPAHLQTRTIDMEEMIEALPIDPAIGVVIIDACRDNPLARTFASTLPATRSSSVNSGLAAIQTATTHGDGTGGLIIGFATDPGSVALDGEGVNSPYTEALAKHLAVPGVPIQSALTRVRGDVVASTNGRQRPWYNASLGREVFLGGTPDIQTPLANQQVASLPQAGALTNDHASPPVHSPTVDATEEAIWSEVQSGDTAAHYEFYLSQYPAGQYAKLAKLKLFVLKKEDGQQLAAVAAAPVTPAYSQPRVAIQIPESVRTIPGTQFTEQAIGMNKAARIDLQVRLRALGFDPKGIDGGIGRNSRTAITQWQTAQQIIPSGYLTPEQWNVMKGQSEHLIAPVYQEYHAQQAAKKARAKKQRKTASRKSGTRSSKKSSSGNNNGIGKAIIGFGAGVLACKIAGC